MSRYFRMPAYPDMMPVDISFVFADEKPAGKHGFMKAVGEEFQFEDGTPARFWGVNINGGANFPSHDYAEKFARRLAQSGCNIVRLHQLDAEWGNPNIFAFTRGKRVDNTRSFDPESMDRLDYLIHCLKEQGIYIYLDMMTYRKFKEGDGVVDAGILYDLAKPWCLIDDHLKMLQKEYMANLWLHYNPYTKLCYKDDPAFVMTEIVAECDLYYDAYSQRYDYQIHHHYYSEYRQVFKKWLEEKGIEYDWENCNMYERNEVLDNFKIDTTRAYMTEMHDYMRSIGVKIPIAGTNWVQGGNNNTRAHDVLDFTDTHVYFYDWRWGTNERLCKNRNITSAPSVFDNQAKMTMAGKPFFMSEWDMPWPNSYRAEGPIYYAAVAALQGWCGACIHTYSYSTHLDKMDVLGQELSSPVAGVPYREGIFSTWNDPAKFGLFYHSALITRRGDIQPAKKRVAVKPHDFIKASAKAMTGLLEQHRARMYFGEDLPEGYDEAVLDDQEVPHPTPNIYMADNGQMWRDRSRQIGAIDTERTKVVYGMLGTGAPKDSQRKPTWKPVELDGLSVLCATDFAVIAMSSLTNDPIEKSNNILLSTIGRVRNTDQVFDGEKMLDVGRAPILAEVIDAQIRMRTKHGKNMKIWGINAEGMYAGLVPSTYEDGWLCFNVGKDDPACYYLIVRD